MTLYIKFKGERRAITHWLIRDDEPFRHAQSFLLPDGTVAYTDGLTPLQYAADHGFPVRVVTDAQLDDMIAAYEASLITDPVEETEEQWWYALEVLPPCKWRTVRGVELFHISERQTGNLVNWHARLNGKFYTFVDDAARDMGELAEKVAKAQRPAMTRAEWEALPSEYRYVRDDGTHTRLALDAATGATISQPVEIIETP